MDSMNLCLDVLTTLCSGLMLEVGPVDPFTGRAESVTVQRRKLPGVGERLDTVPLLAICPDERQPERVPWDSRPSMKRTCVITLGLVAKGNRDPITAQEQYPVILSKIANLVAHPRTLRGLIPGYLMGRMREETNFNRAAYAEGYDYLILKVELEIIEALTL